MMKLKQIRQVKSAIDAVKSVKPEYAIFLHLRKNEKAIRPILEAELDVRPQPPAAAAYNTELSTRANEYNAGTLEDKRAILSDLAKKYPSAIADDIAWQMAMKQAENENYDVAFTPMPAKALWVDGKCQVLEAVEILIDAGIFDELE